MIPNECTQCGGVEWEPLMKMSLGEDADMWECQGCLAIVAERGCEQE